MQVSALQLSFFATGVPKKSEKVNENGHLRKTKRIF
jgi:hypothetical protein